jgi:hypothetical protein
MSDAKRPEINEDPLVQQLVRDPAKPGAKLFSGYVGRSTSEGSWRLYLSLAFDDYLEFRESDIVHVETVGGKGGSQAGAWVWLSPDAAVQHIRGEHRGMQGEFLGGDISKRFLHASPGGTVGLASPLFPALPQTFSVTACATCPTDDGAHTCFPAVCTLATSCYTTVPIDRGCGGRLIE